MNKILSLTLVAFTLPGAQHLRAQGCSDAGVCTAGPIGELSLMDSAQRTAEPRHMARVTFSYAVGEQNTTIAQVVPEIAMGLTERWGLQFRVPYMSATGNLGSNSGMGDAVITTSYAFVAQDAERLDVIAGAKLPANAADAQADGKPLPMPYQTSLGTTDLLLGLNFRTRRWNTALAYQHVLSNGNANGFRHSSWPGNSEAEGYFESWELDRADDAVARLQYTIPVGELSIQPGLLAIYHVAQDKRQEMPTDPAGMIRSPEVVEVDGSEGLTLNLTVDARYLLSNAWSVELAFGSPLVTREVRPDGLTRSLVLNVGLAYRFGKQP